MTTPTDLDVELKGFRRAPFFSCYPLPANAPVHRKSRRVAAQPIQIGGASLQGMLYIRSSLIRPSRLFTPRNIPSQILGKQASFYGVLLGLVSIYGNI